jgi:hypothetical protein
MAQGLKDTVFPEEEQQQHNNLSYCVCRDWDTNDNKIYQFSQNSF